MRVTPDGEVKVPEVLKVWLPAGALSPPNIAIFGVPAAMFKPQS
jgi:hypothetical protein